MPFPISKYINQSSEPNNIASLIFSLTLECVFVPLMLNLDIVTIANEWSDASAIPAFGRCQQSMSYKFYLNWCRLSDSCKVDLFLALVLIACRRRSIQQLGTAHAWYVCSICYTFPTNVRFCRSYYVFVRV